MNRKVEMPTRIFNTVEEAIRAFRDQRQYYYDDSKKSLAMQHIYFTGLEGEINTRVEEAYAHIGQDDHYTSSKVDLEMVNANLRMYMDTYTNTEKYTDRDREIAFNSASLLLAWKAVHFNELFPE